MNAGCVVYIGMLKFESLGQDVSRRLYTRNDEMMLTGWAIHWDTLFALITLTPNRPHFYFCDATVDHTFCIPFISTFTLTRGMLRWNRSKLSSRSTDSKSPSNLAESAWSLKMNIPFNLRATSPITTRWTQDFRACTSLCHQQCEWKMKTCEQINDAQIGRVSKIDDINRTWLKKWLLKFGIMQHSWMQHKLPTPFGTCEPRYIVVTQWWALQSKIPCVPRHSPRHP